MASKHLDEWLQLGLSKSRGPPSRPPTPHEQQKKLFELILFLSERFNLPHEASLNALEYFNRFLAGHLREAPTPSSGSSTSELSASVEKSMERKTWLRRLLACVQLASKMTASSCAIVPKRIKQYFPSITRSSSMAAECEILLALGYDTSYSSMTSDLELLSFLLERECASDAALLVSTALPVIHLILLNKPNLMAEDISSSPLATSTPYRTPSRLQVYVEESPMLVPAVALVVSCFLLGVEVDSVSVLNGFVQGDEERLRGLAKRVLRLITEI